MKPLKALYSEGNIKYYGTDKDVLVPETYEEKDVETRGVWISTVVNIDIPKMESVESYKNKLKDIIATMKEYHLNTAVFQVRPTNDAWYESNLNPWSKYITGEQGKNPGFDIFGYFIDEAKKNNITVHAWVNPYRIALEKLSDLNMTKEEFLNTLAPSSFARVYPECVIETSETKLILDPASEKVRQFVSDSILEIAEKYDVKAVHMDDYFYPYDAIKDDKEEEKFKASGFEKLADFRRDNVNKLIKMIHDKLTKLPKKVEFGISPFGIYRTNSRFCDDKLDDASWDRGSNNHQSCFTCYKGLYADIYLWMKEKWIDYVVPQNYFDFENKKPEKVVQVQYADLAVWWNDIAKECGTKLYMGLGMYRYSDEGSWANPEEIINQIKFNTTLDTNSGNIFFTYGNFTSEKIASQVKARTLLKDIWTKDVEEI